ncbi:MAG: helix-turn-helix transcriptional regulator [Lachnospiraceae bacterium]|jgi:transcriptional regulator with XRE-family HTH domain|nr:helix-turn-helix transcriptional regulator [Lachnospiraceae bacterium]
MTSSFTGSDQNAPASHIPFSSLRLREARTRRGLTIENVSRLAGLNKMTLLRYESGDIRTISPDRLIRLAQIYETSPAWLAGIASHQEFLSRPHRILLSPDQADPPSRLGFRLLICLRYFSSGRS